MKNKTNQHTIKQKKQEIKQPEFFKYDFWVYSIITIFVIFLYGNTFNHNFVVDDKIVVSDNKNVQKGISAIPSIFTHTTFYGFVEGNADKTYRPVTLSSLALEIEIFGMKAGVHHFFNVLYYLILCILLYYFLKKYLLVDYNKLFSFLVTLLFVIHPIHTEVVCNIKSRDEILCFIFLVVSLIFLFKYLKTKKTKLLIISGLFYFIGLFTKETAVTFIILFPLFVFFFSTTELKNYIKILTPFVTALLLFMIIRHMIIKDIDTELTYINNGLLAFDIFFERYCLTFYILLLYIKLLIAPHPLVWDYSFGHFEINITIILLGIVSLIIHLALFVFALINFRKKYLLAFLILFYLITLALVSNVFIPIASTMGERFLFIPSFAFCFAVIFLLAKVFKLDFRSNKLKSGSGFVIILIIVLILFSTKTYTRSKDWKDDYTLTLSNYENTNSFRARMSYVEVLYKRAGLERNNQQLFHNIRIEMKYLVNDYPKNAETWYLNGIINTSLQKRNEAINSYKKAIQINNRYLNAINNLASIYHSNGELDYALEYYYRIIKIDSNYTMVYGNIGKIFHQKGNLNEAIKYYKKALEYEPNNKTIRDNYNNIYIKN